MALATLSIDLEARLARLENDLKGATSLIERQSARMAKSFSSVGDVFKGGLGAIAIAELSARFSQLVPNVVNGIDKLNDLADATGSSVENISALEDIAARTGGTIDTVAQALVKFNAQLGNAKAGSDQARILESIGLSADKLRQMDPAEALLATAKALNTFADDGNKARLVQELFGKSIQEVGPFLKDLAERGQLVAKVTTAQAKAAEQFNQHLANISKNSLDAARAISGPLVASLNDLLTKFREAQKEGKATEFTFEQLGRKALKLLPPQVQAAALLIEARSRAGTFGGVAQVRADNAGGGRGSVNPDYALQAGGGRGFVNPEPVKPRAPGLPDKIEKPPIDEAQKYLDNLQRQLEATREYTALEKVLADLQAGRLKASKAVSAEQLKAAASEIDAAKEAIRLADERAAQRKKDYDDAEAAFRANQEADRQRLNSLKDMSSAAAMERLASDIDYLREKMYAGKLEADEYADIILKLMERLGVVAPKVKGLADQVGEAFGGALETLIVDGGRARDVIRALEQDIVRLFIRQQVTQPAAKELGTFLTGLLASANGNAFAGGQLQAFAQGGTVSQPTLFTYGGGRKGLMGEAGTEGILPLKRGRDGKLGVISQGGGGDTTHINITVPMVPGGDRRTAMQQGEIIGRQVALARRRNG